jgi:RNA polymerase sigma-70 factor (ECF subfamily)
MTCKGLTSYRNKVVMVLDNSEYIEVFSRYKDDVYRFIYSYMKNSYDTDDIFQNVFEKLYRRPQGFGDDGHIKKWLITVAANECKSRFFSSWTRRVGSITEELENTLCAEDAYNESSACLNAVLALPKKYRSVIHLYYYEEYSINEIAEILGIKETTIQTQLARARARLKVSLIGGQSHEY